MCYDASPELTCLDIALTVFFCCCATVGVWQVQNKREMACQANIQAAE